MIGSAALVHPLRQLPKEFVRFLWTEECHEAFEGVKHALMLSAPLQCWCCRVDLSKCFEVICDAWSWCGG